jgi:hypothetical protein
VGVATPPPVVVFVVVVRVVVFGLTVEVIIVVGLTVAVTIVVGALVVVVGLTVVVTAGGWPRELLIALRNPAFELTWVISHWKIAKSAFSSQTIEKSRICKTFVSRRLSC